jgi:peptide chain release factor subunit 1
MKGYMTEEEKYRLKRLLDELAKVRGRHTELVSVYVPAGYNIALVSNQLAQEAGTAENIKSKAVRTNVVTALEKIISELRKYPKTPEHGLVLFSGNVSETEGKPDYKLWAIHPPEPINVRMYRCAQEFVIEPLREQFEAKTVYGLVVIDHKNATLALLKGKTILPIKEMESYVAGKMKAGGQSAARFAHAREEQIKYFFNKVADLVRASFLHVKNLRGIIVGGPGPSKEDFVNSGYLSTEVRKLVLGVKDVGYTGEQGLRELVAKSEDLLKNEAIVEEKKVLEEFFGNLAKGSGLVTYGENEVREKLETGTVAKLLLSEALPPEKVDAFLDVAKRFSTEVVFISEETNEGKQLKELGGFAAILRYRQ